MEHKELFYHAQEAYEQMLTAKNTLRDRILSLVRQTIESLGEGCLSLSLVIPEQRHVQKRPGYLVEYVEMDRIWTSEDGSIQLSGFIEGTDDMVLMNITELDIHELYSLMHLLFGEQGTTFDIIPLEEASCSSHG